MGKVCVRILVGMAGLDFSWRRGMIRELPEAEAAQLVKHGVAELVDPTPEPEPEPVEPVKPSKGRPKKGD